MRLFGRLESIRKIISALGKSLIPVGNAFIIVLLIMSVYAIVGVNLFREANSAAFGSWSRCVQLVCETAPFRNDLRPVLTCFVHVM